MQYPTRRPAAVVEPLESRQLLAVDLTSTVIAVLPPDAIGGQKIKAGVVVTVTNNGDEPAKGRTDLQVLFDVGDNNHQLDGNEVLMFTAPVKLNLKPGKSKALKVKIRTLPADAPDGRYHVFTRLNVAGQIAETDLANNVAVDVNVHVEYRQPRMDLAAAFSATAGGTPVSIRPGKSAKVLVDIFNSANVTAAGKITFAINASADTTADPVGIPLATGTAKIKIEPDGLRTYKVKFKVPKDFPAGTYFLVGTVDATNVLGETDEANNTFPGFSAVTIA